MTLCKCGCKQKVKSGNRYIHGHINKGKKLSEETRKKISLANKGKVFTEEHKKSLRKAAKGKKFSEKTKRKISKSLEGNQNSKGFKHTEETREKISKIRRGSKNPSFKYGKDFILNQHKQYKKQKCFFGCKKAKQYDLHHEPKLEKNILEWEGRLVNLCTNCHKKVHAKTLELPEDAGVLWTLKDTKKILKGD